MNYIKRSIFVFLLNTFRLKTLNKIEVQIAGWGNRFGFGYHDPKMLRKGTYDDPTMYSSCMTTHESPRISQYQRCNTLEVI